jgi:PPOX class probable F420-dependent enzyme
MTRPPERARRFARPRPGKSLPGGRVADRLSLPPQRILDEIELLELRGGPPATWNELAARPHVVLVTFRRDGRRVATPVWSAMAAGVLYARTQRSSGKVKRLRNNGSVLLAPCSTRGVPLAVPVRGQARLLDAGEEAVAERALRGKYGLVRALCAAGQDLLRVDMCYLAITEVP